MSSTGRGYDRHKVDYYITPQWCINDFFDALEGDMKDGEFTNCVKTMPTLNGLWWLDPCAGGGMGNVMPYVDIIKDRYNPEVMDSIDIREDSMAMVKSDYLKTGPLGPYDMVITNPPFYIAQEVITKALTDVVDGGYVIMLLRLNFFGSNARKEFFKNHMPILSYVHNKRISFTNGGTDSIEYMHSVWQNGVYPKFTALRVI